MRLLRKFLKLEWDEKLLLAEALYYLTSARLMLWVVPFKYIARNLGVQINANSPQEIQSNPEPQAYRVARAIESLSRRTPWESTCLAQSIAGKQMLRRRKIKNILYLGMKKDKDGKLSAHAWLQSGNLILLGGQELKDFTPISGFMDS